MQQLKISYSHHDYDQVDDLISKSLDSWPRTSQSSMKQNIPLPAIFKGINDTWKIWESQKSSPKLRVYSDCPQLRIKYKCIHCLVVVSSNYVTGIKMRVKTQF